MQSHPDALCWRQGLSGWQPARAMPEFAEAFGDGLPDDMPPQRFYVPTDRGLEGRIAEKLAQLRERDRQAGGEED